MEHCVLCHKYTKCSSLFLYMPFCDKCDIKLYNGDINISDSIKQNRLIFSDEHDEIDEH